MNLNPYTIAVLLVQIGLVVHVLKTGRNPMWVFLLIFVPLLGSVVYLVIEILPGVFGGVSGQRATRGMRATLDPGGDSRKHAAAFEHSPNADNARRYAQALLGRGQARQAEAVLEKVMTGLFRTDPNLLLLKARARFEQDDAGAAVNLLRELRAANPDFKSADAQLLYAQALEAIGETSESLEEYQSVAGYYPGAEARYRLGLALKAAGQDRQAREVFEQMAKDAKHAPAHFRKAQKTWLRKAANELKSL